jgi:hypothetical protein
MERGRARGPNEASWRSILRLHVRSPDAPPGVLGAGLSRLRPGSRPGSSS